MASRVRVKEIAIAAHRTLGHQYRIIHPSLSEPSQKTFEFHWGKHHQAYITNLSNQIKTKNDLQNLGLEEIIHKTWNGGNPTPEFNNAAQAWNHSFFWECLSPNGGGEPTGALAEAIAKDFGSLDAFKEEFAAAAATQFGSGWAWLVDSGKGLAVRKTPNAVTPIVNDETPLLTIDVWEHAYYLDFQNRRPDFIKNFWNIVNWAKVRWLACSLLEGCRGRVLKSV